MYEFWHSFDLRCQSVTFKVYSIIIPIIFAESKSVWNFICNIYIYIYVIVKSHYEEVIVVITRVRGGAEDECNNNDNLRVQWDLTGFYPIVFDVRHITQ